VIDLDGVRIRTARNTYTGPGGVLDVTRSAGRGVGLALAPSQDLVYPTIERRREIEKLTRRASRVKSEPYAAELRERGRTEEAELWNVYEPAYLAEMRVSAGVVWPGHKAWGPLEALALERGVRPNRGAWTSLPSCARDSLLVLVCFCGERYARIGHCHRVLLAEKILAKFGAVYEGEAPAEEQPSIGGVIAGRRSARGRAQ
jgi:hypothetical protein